MSEIATVYAIFPNAEEATRIACLMIEEKLAACANILGACHSIYRWEGKVEESTEVPVLFKVRADGTSTLIARIAEEHSYDVPAIMVWPIDMAHPAYEQWVLNSVEVL